MKNNTTNKITIDGAPNVNGQYHKDGKLVPYLKECTTSYQNCVIHSNGRGMDIEISKDRSIMEPKAGATESNSNTITSYKERGIQIGAKTPILVTKDVIESADKLLRKILKDKKINNLDKEEAIILQIACHYFITLFRPHIGYEWNETRKYMVADANSCVYASKTCYEEVHSNLYKSVDEAIKQNAELFTTPQKMQVFTVESMRELKKNSVIKDYWLLALLMLFIDGNQKGEGQWKAGPRVRFQVFWCSIAKNIFGWKDGADEMAANLFKQNMIHDDFKESDFYRLVLSENVLIEDLKNPKNYIPATVLETELGEKIYKYILGLPTLEKRRNAILTFSAFIKRIGSKENLDGTLISPNHFGTEIFGAVEFNESIESYNSFEEYLDVLENKVMSVINDKKQATSVNGKGLKKNVELLKKDVKKFSDKKMEALQKTLGKKTFAYLMNVIGG